jgi:hypothetical protein
MGILKNTQLAKQLLITDFIFLGKYLLRNPNGIGFKVFQMIDFFLETDTVEETISEVYTLSYKNISVTECNS